MIIDTRICGIPCKVRVNTYHTPEPHSSCSADYYGGVDYDVLDRNGKPATWLLNKMTWDDEQALVSVIESAYFSCLY